MGVAKQPSDKTGDSMHGLRLLHKRLKGSGSLGHVTRLGVLMKAVEGLLAGRKLALTHLGRSLARGGSEKHNIKCMDRLIGNPHMHRERPDIYSVLARWLLSNCQRPVVIIDWSDVVDGHRQLMLTAAIPMGGRALPIYEEVHPLRRYNSPRTHRLFLKRLAEILPQNKRPIIVTDAGFRGPWFRQVEALGWDWVGRIRNKVKYSLDEGDSWRYTTRLYSQATSRIRHLGWGWLSAKNPYGCYLYLVKKYHRGRGRPKKAHGAHANAQRCRKLYKDPWLLATSLEHSRGAGKRIVKLYSLRMQIEETFRDLKNARWGLGLQYARSRSHARLENLLLIGTLAMFVIWLAGLIAKTKEWIRHFQANTERRYPVLSVFFLGTRLLESRHFKFTQQDVNEAFQNLPNIAAKQVEFVGIS